MSLPSVFEPSWRGYFFSNEAFDQFQKFKVWNQVSESRFLVLFLTIQKTKLEDSGYCKWDVKASGTLFEEGQEHKAKKIKVPQFEVLETNVLGSWDYFSARDGLCVNMDPWLNKEDLGPLFNAALVRFQSFPNGFQINFPLMYLEEEA